MDDVGIEEFIANAICEELIHPTHRVPIQVQFINPEEIQDEFDNSDAIAFCDLEYDEEDKPYFVINLVDGKFSITDLLHETAHCLQYQVIGYFSEDPIDFHRYLQKVADIFKKYTGVSYSIKDLE